MSPNFIGVKMSYLEELVKRPIELFDRYYSREQSLEIELGNFKGRIIHGKIPVDLFQEYNPESERLATLREVAKARTIAYRYLLDNVPSIRNLMQGILLYGTVDRELVKEARDDLLDVIDENPLIFNIWKVRLTTSTPMARAKDSTGNEYIFFCDINPFEDNSRLASALQGRLSDGGIEFDSSTLSRVVRESYARIPYKEYIDSRGGNFNGQDWLRHPVFRAAFNDSLLIVNYVLAMQILNLTDFYNQGLHSGWIPREMQEGFGRFLSLGYKGEAFYPVNASTTGHAALVVPKNFKI